MLEIRGELVFLVTLVFLIPLAKSQRHSVRTTAPRLYIIWREGTPTAECPLLSSIALAESYCASVVLSCVHRLSSYVDALSVIAYSDDVATSGVVA